MAKDYLIEGHNTPKMVKVANHYKKLLGVSDDEQVDIVHLLEFRLSKIHPDFRLVIKRDRECESDAYTDFENSWIVVRETVYCAAYEGDVRCRMILAHELGHFLLHKEKGRQQMHKTRDGSYNSITGLNSTESTETQADMFAEYFLVSLPLAYNLRDNALQLAKTAKVPLSIAKTVISASKRPSLRALALAEMGPPSNIADIIPSVTNSGNISLENLQSIIPAKYPVLRSIMWNRDTQRAISAEDAFALYERNWRFVDQKNMKDEERQLVADLTTIVGNGVILT